MRSSGNGQSVIQRIEMHSDYVRMFGVEALIRVFPYLKGRYPLVKTISIIGNGPVTPEDRVRVRDSQLVVRFNNWGSRKGLEETLSVVGGRCEVCFSNMDTHTTNQGVQDISEARMLVQAIPYPHRFLDADRLAERWYPKAFFCMINPFWVRDLCSLLGFGPHPGVTHPMPTAGMTGLYSFFRMKLPSTYRFYASGFTWNRDPDTGLFDGIQPKLPEPPEWKPSNHYFLREARLVQSLLGDNPQWEFSSLAQEALQASLPVSEAEDSL